MNKLFPTFLLTKESFTGTEKMILSRNNESCYCMSDMILTNLVGAKQSTQLYLKCFNLFYKGKCLCKLWEWGFTWYSHGSDWLTLVSPPREISFRAAFDRFVFI